MTDRATFLSAGMALTASVGFPIAARAADPVSVLYAGSLVTVMERTIVPALATRGLDVLGEPKGSVALAKLIESGVKSPDVFVSADPKLIDEFTTASPPLARWYVTFATTRLVIGYARTSPFAADFALAARGGKPIADVLLEPNLRLGRTDPALDPKGYRSIVVAQLLERDGAPVGFARKLLGDDDNAAQILPEETLLARLESGDLDAAFLYATEGVARGVPFVELPPNDNLGDPTRDAHYALASVTVGGKRHGGAAASYALTILAGAPHPAAAARFVSYLLSSDGRATLAKAGVTPIAPVVSGDRGAIPVGVADGLAI